MKKPDGNGGFTAWLKSYTNYYGFGMAQPERSFASSSYRYGYNGKEKDDELKGSGNSYDYGARFYDPRVGRWLSSDPLESKYPHLSTYIYANNNPIICVDIDGRDWILFNGTRVIWYGGKLGDKSTVVKEYRGTSGASGNNPSNSQPYQQANQQAVKDKGPIPEGKYSINLSLDPNRTAPVDAKGETVRSIGLSLLPWENKGLYWGWGTWRARLEAQSGTDLFGRENNFYFHDSYKGESHGCVETETALRKDLIDYAAAGNKKIEVLVDYPSEAATTNGGTNAYVRVYDRSTNTVVLKGYPPWTCYIGTNEQKIDIDGDGSPEVVKYQWALPQRAKSASATPTTPCTP